ncbi:hypothetical protein HDU93_002514 [Gonapodya sp. JEL0774]|nr:hypothetical protein HDU93_002514 [Gonapodya sp. JEL0774]
MSVPSIQETARSKIPGSPGISTPHHFDADTAVKSVSGRPGWYECSLHPRWQNNNGTVFGGYIIPIVLRAIGAELAPYGFDKAVSCYLQYLIAPRVDDTIELEVKVMKRGKNYAFTTTTIYSRAKKVVRLHQGATSAVNISTLITHVQAPSHVVTAVFGTSAARNPTLLRERRIDHLRKPSFCVGGPKNIDELENMWLLMGRTDAHHFNRGIEMLMHRRDFTDLKVRASQIQTKSNYKAIPPPRDQTSNNIPYPSSKDEMMELSADLAVRFRDGRSHDDLSVAMVTDAVWAMNEFFAMDQGLPRGKRFTSSTMSLALHFFASPLPNSSYLCCRGDITVVNGRFSEFEALIFDQQTGALLCTGRQVQVTDVESDEEVKEKHARRTEGVAKI